MSRQHDQLAALQTRHMRKMGSVNRKGVLKMVYSEHHMLLPPFERHVLLLDYPGIC
jgi:hypothetical protein